MKCAKDQQTACSSFKTLTKLHGTGAYVFRASLLLNLALFVVLFSTSTEKSNLLFEPIGMVALKSNLCQILTLPHR